MDKVIFPHETLTPIIGKPTRMSLTVLKRELFANARSVPSTLGGGALGHAFLLMTPAEFAALPTALPVVAPAHPGPQPPHAAAATGPQITQTNRSYDAELEAFALYHGVRERCKQLLLKAVEPKYLAKLQDRIMGHAAVTPQAMLAHLFSAYGKIKPDDLDTNCEALIAPWTPESSLETLWARIRECQEIATDGNEPINDATVIMTCNH